MTNYTGYATDATSGYPTGGVICALLGSMAYTDTTAKTLFTIPAGAYIADWIINVTTAFNDSGTDVLDLGITGTTQKFAAAVDVTAAGLKTTNVVLTQVGAVQATAQTIKGIYTGQNGNASTGAALIIVRFFIP